MKRPSKRGRKKTSSPMWNILRTACVFILALTVGLLMPDAVLAIQDLSAGRMNEVVDLGDGALSLTSDSARIEKLRAASRMMSAYSMEGTDLITLNSQGRFMTAQDAVGLFDEVWALVQGTGLNAGDYDKYESYGATPVFMLSEDNNASGICWIVSFGTAWDEEELEQSISYLVDDTTGMILSAACYGPSNYSSGIAQPPDLSEGIGRLAESFAASQGFGATKTEVEAPIERNPRVNTYYVNFMQDSELLYQMPVSVSPDSWSINQLA